MMEIEINDDDATQQQQQNQPGDIATAADFPLLLSEKDLSTGEEVFYYMRVNGRPPQPAQSLDAIDHWSKQGMPSPTPLSFFY